MPDYTYESFSDAPSTEAPTYAEAGRSDFRSSVINLERPGDPSVFSDAVRADAATVIARYPEGQARSALLPLLHLVQSEQGHVSPDGIAFCSDLLGLTKAQVTAVATFYTMYKRKPTGEYLVSVCTNTLCGLMGGDEIWAALRADLGIGMNETTEDGSLTIEHAECLAACDYAPVVTVNYEFFDNQSVESTRELVADLRAGRRPQPTRGAPLCSFKQAERQIAGLFTPADFALDVEANGAPTMAGVELAQQRGESAPSYAAATANDDYTTSRDEAVAEEQPDETGEAPLSQAESGGEVEAGAETRSAEKRAEQGVSSGPSQDDAPLQTAESDPHNPTDPAAKTEKED